MLIQSNERLEYVILAGVTPVTKAGWYSGLNNVQVLFGIRPYKGVQEHSCIAEHTVFGV